MGSQAHAPQGDALTVVADELVVRARDGDRFAFDQLVRDTYQDTYSLALKLTGDEHDARDAVQEAYLRAYRAIRRFRGDAAFSTWLHRITANCSSTLTRIRGRRQHQDIDSLRATGEADPVDNRPDHDPEECSCRRADLEALRRAIALLPDRLRVVLVLRDVCDLPHQAIAAELGISTGAAKVRVHRARQQLRERLSELQGGIAGEAGNVEEVGRAG